MSDRFTFESMPRLESARLVLREADPGRDLECLFELFADPEVARFTDTGPFTTLDEAVDVMAWISDIFTRHRGMRWVIAPASAEERLIGTCGFNVWRPSNNSAEIGYDLARPHWGQGLMTEALGLLLRFGFERMDLNRVEADVTVGNDGSVRVLEKLGFQEEGVLRQRGFWKGDYHDLRLFSLLHEEWARPGAWGLVPSSASRMTVDMGPAVVCNGQPGSSTVPGGSVGGVSWIRRYREGSAKGELDVDRGWGYGPTLT